MFEQKLQQRGKARGSEGRKEEGEEERKYSSWESEEDLLPSSHLDFGSETTSVGFENGEVAFSLQLRLSCARAAMFPCERVSCDFSVIWPAERLSHVSHSTFACWFMTNTRSHDGCQCVWQQDDARVQVSLVHSSRAGRGRALGATHQGTGAPACECGGWVNSEVIEAGLL